MLLVISMQSHVITNDNIWVTEMFAYFDFESIFAERWTKTVHGPEQIFSLITNSLYLRSPLWDDCRTWTSCIIAWFRLYPILLSGISQSRTAWLCTLINTNIIISWFRDCFKKFINDFKIGSFLLRISRSLERCHQQIYVRFCYYRTCGYWLDSFLIGLFDLMFIWILIGVERVVYTCSDFVLFGWI